MNLDFDGKTALITDGFGVIAEHVLKALSTAGATLIVTDRQADSTARPILEAWGVGAHIYLARMSPILR